MMTDFNDHEFKMLDQAAAWRGENRLAELDDQLLCQLSRARGVDFATSLLYRSIRSSAEHGNFIRRLEDLLRDDAPEHAKLDAALVIAPGAFYRERPETGADGKSLCRVSASLGCRTHVIPTESVGSAAVNGRIICDWLLNESEQNVILCSLSKGGADVKMALAERDAAEAFRSVVAWINVGGITNGSPMANWLLKRPALALIYRALFWWRGQDFRFIRDLARRPGSPLDFKISLPPHVRAVHVIGFPLTQHVCQRRTRRWHRRLAYHGPNDGATILADSCGLPGLIFPVWGADHYLDAERSPEKLLASLLRYLGEELQLFAVPAQATSFAESSTTK
jgi:hypothetical protein